MTNILRIDGNIFFIDTGKKKYPLCFGQSIDAYIGEPGGIFKHSLFTYCGNNPVIRDDPDGLDFGTDVYNAMAWLFPGSAERWEVAKQDPSAFNISNWLSGGIVGAAKGAVAPKEPLSLQHWLDSFNIVYTGMFGYSVGKNYAFIKATTLKPQYPPRLGFKGFPFLNRLKVGEEVARYGGVYGQYVTTPGTAPTALSLPPDKIGIPPVLYVIKEPIWVLSGKAAPWFNQPGGGTQYYFFQIIKTLLEKGKLGVIP